MEKRNNTSPNQRMPAIEATPSRLKLGMILMVISCVFFATASSLVYHFRGRFPTIQIIFIQNFVSLICILPMALRRGPRYMQTNLFPLHLFRDIMGVGSYFLYFLTIRYLNLVDATTLHYTTPFFIPLVWRLWQKEKIQTNVWWSIIVGFVGVALILNPSQEIFRLGFVVGISSGILSAIALVTVRILGMKQEPPCRTLFYYFSVGSLLSLPFAWSNWVQPNGEEWFFAIGIGLATALGQIFLIIAYRHGTASFLAPLSYSTVVYNTIIACIIFNQEISLRSWIGTIFIVIGGTASYIFKKKPVPTAASSAELLESQLPSPKGEGL